ncbi:MAG: hypothetical protein RLZZ187_3739 [Pseudomonadota bacterium]|jgi:adhesin transport system membrane fusion protein
MRPDQEFDALMRERRGSGAARNSLLLFTIVALVTCFFVWAAIAEIDGVKRADGRVVPSSNVQMVQAAEPGVIRALHVRRGQIVEEGAVLLELDPTSVSSELEQHRTRLWGLMARVARLQAQVDGRHVLEFPPELIAAVPAIVASEVALFRARQDELQAEIDVLEQQRQQRLQEQQEAEVENAMARDTLDLVQAEIRILRPLVQRRIEPETALLALQRTQVEVSGRRARSEAALRRLASALAEIDDRIAALRSRFRSEALGQLALSTAELSEIRARLPAFALRVSRSEVRAPVRGTVNHIHTTTVGGVVQLGQNLVEIVPADDALLVEAFVRPSDIAFMYPGQAVRVSVTAYDFSRYGSLEGEITRIAADSTQRPDRQERAFAIEIRTKTNILDADGAALEILPGMVVEANILSRRRTILEYMTTPIVRVRDRALRE